MEYLPTTKNRRGVSKLSLCPFSEPLEIRKGWKARFFELGDRSIQCAVGRRGRSIDLECRVRFHADRMTPILWAEWNGRDSGSANQLLRFLADVPLGPPECLGNALWLCGLCATGDKSFLKSREDVQNDVLLGG
jgi:hypothetical protein